MVLEKTLESPLGCKTKLVHPKEINPEYSLEGLMLKLKLQSFGHLMQIADPLEKTLMLAKVHIVKAMVFPVVMYECESWDCIESRALKN